MTRTSCDEDSLRGWAFSHQTKASPTPAFNCKIRHPGRPWTDAAARVGRTGTGAGGGPRERRRVPAPGRCPRGRQGVWPGAPPAAPPPASVLRLRRPRLWPVTPCAATPLGRRSLPGPLHTRKRCRQGDDRVTLSCSRWVPGRDGRCAPGPCSGSSGDPALLAVSAEGQDTDRVPEPPEGAGPGHRVCCPSRAQASRT